MNIWKQIAKVSTMHTKAMIEDQRIVSFLPRIFFTASTIAVQTAAMIVHIGPRVGNSVLLMHLVPSLLAKNPGLVHSSTHVPSCSRYGFAHSKQLAPLFDPHLTQFSAHGVHC